MSLSKEIKILSNLGSGKKITAASYKEEFSTGARAYLDIKEVSKGLVPEVIKQISRAVKQDLFDEVQEVYVDYDTPGDGVLYMVRVSLYISDDRHKELQPLLDKNKESVQKALTQKGVQTPKYVSKINQFAQVSRLNYLTVELYFTPESSL